LRPFSDRIPDPAAGSKMIDDFWGPSKRILSDPKFIENLSSLDKDSISAKTAKHIRDKYLSNPDINPDKSKSPVAAMDVMARGLYRFEADFWEIRSYIF
jgi:dynein heavy chain